MQDVVVKNKHDPNCACSRCHSEKLPLIQKEPREDKKTWDDRMGQLAVGWIFIVMIVWGCYAVYDSVYGVS